MTTPFNITEKLGSRIHEKDLAEIANLATENDKGLIDTLLHLVYDESTEPIKKKISENATWAIQHLHEKDLDQFVLPHKESLIQLAMKTHSISKQRMLLSLLRDTPFSKDELSSEFIDFCLSTMVSGKYPVGIRALCIHLAYIQCKYYPELLQELKEQLDLMENDLLQPGLKSAKTNTLKLINDLKNEKVD